MSFSSSVSPSQLRQKIKTLRRSFEEELGTLVEIPTVSMDPSRQPEMRKAADYAADLLRGAGAEVAVIETGGAPMIVGRIGRDPARPTVTIYNHIDVQPADPAEWKTPPFTFTVQKDIWRGRGTTDDKGPALAALYGAKLAVETGAAVNIQFLWELEEEIGSPNFATGLKRLLAGGGSGDGQGGLPGFSTDSVVVSDTIWAAAGHPSIPYGLRGLMGFTIGLRTGRKSVHSGTTGGAARNPMTELAGLIAACVDARTGKVKIPGFYDDVRPLSVAEKKGFARAGFSGKRFKAAHELLSLRPLDDLGLMAAIMAQPTFEVHGLVGGYTGPGIKTIVPHEAEAKLSTRLVPDQKPEKVFKLIKAFVKGNLPDAVVTHEASLEPYLAELGGPYNQAGLEAMKETFGREPGFTREGGSIGAVLTMRRLLRAPVIFLGLSLPEHGYHAVDENFDWGQASGGMEMFCRYFHKLGELPKVDATHVANVGKPKAHPHAAPGAEAKAPKAPGRPAAAGASSARAPRKASQETPSVSRTSRAATRRPRKP